MLIYGLERIEGKVRQIERDENGKPFVFSSGKEAAEEAAHRNVAFKMEGKSTRIRAKSWEDEAKADLDREWVDRERLLLLTGKHTHVPWHRESCCIISHFAHLSTTEKGAIAFTASSQHGEQRRYTKMGAWKYLQKYYVDTKKMNKQTAHIYACQIWAQTEAPEVRFAKTAEEMAFVYNNGPYSCVVSESNKALEEQAGRPAVAAYAAGDLAIAYIMSNGLIRARAICWPDKKIMGRIYGDGAAGSRALMEWAHQNKWEVQSKDVCGKFAGARLNKIVLPHSSMPVETISCGNFGRVPFIGKTGILLPYLDHAHYVAITDDPNILVIAPENRSGLEPNKVLCARNGGDSRVAVYLCNEEIGCGNAAGSHHKFVYHPKLKDGKPTKAMILCNKCVKQLKAQCCEICRDIYGDSTYWLGSQLCSNSEDSNCDYHLHQKGGKGGLSNDALICPRHAPKKELSKKDMLMSINVSTARINGFWRPVDLNQP